MNFYFILLTIIFTLPSFGMELPPKQAHQTLVPSLVELAARKCQAVIEPFDPSKDYSQAVKNLNSRAVHHVVGKNLAPLLARSNAQTLQSILDEEIVPSVFNTSYSNSHQNLYENNHGIYEYSGSFFKPPLDDNKPDTKHRSVTFCQDKAVCVTSDQLTLTLWDVVSGNQIKQIQYPINGQDYHDLRPIKFSPDGKIVYARFREDLDNLQGGKPNCVTHMCAFDVATGQLLYENMNAGWGFSVGKKFIYLPKPNGLQVRDLVTNVLYKAISVTTGNSKVSYCISPEDDYLCDVPFNGPKSIFILSVPQENLLQVLNCKDAVRGMQLNRLGTRLAALTQSSISIWAPRTGQQLAIIPHTKEAKLHLIGFADNDRAIYTLAQNIIAGWDIENKKLLFAKEIPFAGPLKDGVYTVKIMQKENAALVWTRLGGDKIHALYSTLGKQLSLKELSALLILEYENQHELPFSPTAVEIVQKTENKLLKQIYEKCYELVPAQVELECASKMGKTIQHDKI